MQKKIPIFYSALLLTGVNVLLRMVSTSFQVFLSGRIGAAGIGLLQLVLSVGTLAMTLSMAGVRTAAMYLCAEELGKKRPENVGWVISGCFLYSIACSTAICVGLMVFAPLIAGQWIGHPETVSAIRLYACFLPLTCLCGVMLGYFTSANRIGTLAIVEIAEQALYMLVTMALLGFWAGTDPTKACRSVILGAGLSSCMTLCVLTFLRIRECAAPGKKIPVGRRLAACAIPLGLGDALRSGISTTENLMVPKRLALYAGVADPLAAFGLVCGMVFPILMFPAAIVYALAELLIPELARCAAAGSHTRVRYLVKKSLHVVLIFSCLCCGTEFLLARELTLRLYKSAEAGSYLRLYALMIPMLYCDAITDAMTKGLGQQTACVRYNILTSFMDVVFLFILLPKQGMMGYYFSFLVTHLLNFLLSLRRLLKTAEIKIDWTEPLLTLICAGTGILLASGASSGTLRVIAFTALFGCLLVITGVVGKRDVRWLKGLIAKKETIEV